MNYILLSLTGFVCGILGGMGMGGGTLLIPALSIFFGIEQHAAQSINLISFIPLALAASAIHLKNRLPDVYASVITGGVACLFSYLGAFIANGVKSIVLKRVFGGFLIILALFQTANFFLREKVKNEKFSQYRVKNNKTTGKKPFKVKKTNKKN